MTLISWSGGPIMRGGAIGTEQACCCGPAPPTGCNCSGSAITLPRQLSVTIAIGASTFKNTDCEDQGFKDIVDGTYVLDFVSMTNSGTRALYHLLGCPLNENCTALNVAVNWSCSGDSELSFNWCNLDNECYQRIFCQVTFAPPNNQTNPYWLQPLCSLVTNDPYTAVIEHAGDRDYPPNFNTGLTNCGQNTDFLTAEYEATFTIEPIW